MPNCALVTDLATNASIDSCDGGAAPAATMTLTTEVAIAAGDQVRVVFTGATNAASPGRTLCGFPLPPMPAGEPATTSWHRVAADSPATSTTDLPLSVTR